MIVLLYDGAIRQLSQARSAIQESAPEARWRHVSKASAIIEGLQGCLDHAAGGEIARLLDRFYTYVTVRLQEINVRNDIGICDEILTHLGTMRASWIAAAERLAIAQAAGAAAAMARQGADLRS
jgi:flagellar protein FliS